MLTATSTVQFWPGNLAAYVSPCLISLSRQTVKEGKHFLKYSLKCCSSTWETGFWVVFFLTGFVDCSAFNWEICINIFITVCLQPASSSDSEGNNAGGGSDEDEDGEEATVPQKVDSGSEVDSDSGSEDQGRGAGVKRKPPPAKVIDQQHQSYHNKLALLGYFWESVCLYENENRREQKQH